MSADPTREIGLQASRWLLRLQDGAQPGENERELNAAFLQWLQASAQHLHVFLETVQTWRLMGTMDPERALQVESLLRNLDADVIAMPGTALRAAPANPPRRPSTSMPHLPRRNVHRGMFAAAALLLLISGAWLAMDTLDVRNYSTDIGEQRTCKLDDGSFIYLNTDSQVQVRFSDQGRQVRLTRGEALFAVERDSRRPFIVEAGNASIRVLGTRFNVRRRPGQTEIAVVEGRVHVATMDARHNDADPGPAPDSTTGGTIAPQPVELTAGERALVDKGRIERAHTDTVTAVAWRTRRLVFTDTPLAEVAAEFNRYNRTRIRVEGEAAASRQLTGIFDADRPKALILYAMKDETLVVSPDGDHWVIGAR